MHNAAMDAAVLEQFTVFLRRLYFWMPPFDAGARRGAESCERMDTQVNPAYDGPPSQRRRRENSDFWDSSTSSSADGKKGVGRESLKTCCALQQVSANYSANCDDAFGHFLKIRFVIRMSELSVSGALARGNIDPIDESRTS
jgi:hypothetical protein